MHSTLNSQIMNLIKQDYLILPLAEFKKKGLICYAKHEKSQKCISLVVKNKEDDIFYHMVISNNQCTLDKSRKFEIINELNHI